ncbi:MAG TPA: class I SAM-dependent methyltransferase [Chloroflexota bacterium]|nr:class I SAM-dependent methyltransferase [Chloroflexota bacterium]
MPLPIWLETLRREEITKVIQRDPRTRGDDLLGVSKARILSDVLGWGQADFDASYLHLSGDDRALLYGWFNLLGHLEELVEAFTQLFASGGPQDPPIVVDVGCGPFTGGLALAAVLEGKPFSYIGMDRSSAMRRLGESLALAAERAGALEGVDRHWVDDFASLDWRQPPGWRPIIVIASYLLASSSLNPTELVTSIDTLCSRLGRGPVTVLYTNSPKDGPNRTFGSFRAALEAAGFTIFADDHGSITIDRFGGARERKLRYALFHRNAQTTLDV